VLDIEPSGPTRGKWVLADAQVAMSGAFRSSKTHGGDDEDMLMDYEGSAYANQIFHTRTHLGAILQPGDAVMGYHLTNANYNSDDFAAVSADRVPDIVLVKKAYPNRRKKNRTREWKLRSMAKEEGEEGETGAGRGVVGRMGGRDQKKVEEDYELFLRELEEDPELRGAVNLYKAKDVRMRDAAAAAQDGARAGKKKGGQYGMEVDDSAQRSQAEGHAEETDGEEDEGDFPDVKLNELLEDFDEMTLGDNGEQQQS